MTEKGACEALKRRTGSRLYLDFVKLACANLFALAIAGRKLREAW